MSTGTDVLKALEAVAPEVLDALGLAELQPLLASAEQLVQNIASAIERKQAPNLAAEVSAADVAADAAEDAKFPIK